MIKKYIDINTYLHYVNFLKYKEVIMINKQDVIKKFKQTDKDTGSSTVQVAILTERIKDLTHHFKIHKKDLHSMRGLLNMVSSRKKLLSYIKSQSQAQYESLIKKLSLRK